MHTNTMRIKETDDIENVFRNFCRKLNDVILGECRMPGVNAPGIFLRKNRKTSKSHTGRVLQRILTEETFGQ